STHHSALLSVFCWSPLLLLSLPGPLSSSCFVFFFYVSVHHRDLPSFPTRRSSDLGGSSARWSCPGAGRPPPARPPASAATGAARSEEHTSELQSLTNLVCRLLLEKKKKQANANITAT